jgi:DNA-directed RNA polymerase specialized sigma24 family protein
MSHHEQIGQNSETLLGGYADKQIAYHLRQLRGVRPPEQDDLRQEMYLALLEKTPVFLKRKSGKRTFIDRTLRYVVRQYFFDRSLYGNVFTASVDRLAENEHPAFNDTRGGEFSELDRIYLQLDVTGFMKKFTPRQRRICHQLISGYRLKRIARRMHTVVKSIRRDIRQIKKLIAEYDFSTG